MPPAVRRSVPTLLAGTLALAYVLVSPPSRDLADALLRARLFGAEPFAIWSNWWYGGHDLVSYSVLFGALAWLLGPQLVAGIAVTVSAALFTVLARGHFGARAELGALWFAAAALTSLLSGRLAFATGLAPALGATLALARGRPVAATALAVLSATVSPVAALFAALAGAACALGARGRRNRLAGGCVVLGALAPPILIALAFGGSGREPFAFSAFWPIPLIGLILWIVLGPDERILRTGALLYTLAAAAAFALPTPVGGNAARLAPLVAGPLLVMAWRPPALARATAAADRRPTASRGRKGPAQARALLVLVVLPLLYLQWQAAIRDVADAAADPSTARTYYQPLLAFLERQQGAPFRVEIPFTANHWEAYYVAPRFALARGWERQLDIEYNDLFYSGTLTEERYRSWLRRLAVRFVAVPDVALDYSASQEARLIDRHPSYLRLVLRTAHWRVFAVAHATPIVQGVATLRALGAGSLTLHSEGPGSVLVRVRYSPYWALTGPAAAGACVAPAGAFTGATLLHAGTIRLVMELALDRIGSRSPRCQPAPAANRRASGD